MVRQLIPIGDEWAVVIDNQLLRDLGIDAHTWLEITPNGKSLLIAPAPIEGQATQDPILDKINRRYRNMFIRMAW